MQKARVYVNRYRWLAGLADLASRYFSAIEWLVLYTAGKIPLHFIRHFIYRLFGLTLGEGSVIYGGAELRAPNKIKIGHHTFVGHQAILDGRGELVIGNNVNFSTGVWIWTAQHNMDAPDFQIEHGKVVIEDYAWVSLDHYPAWHHHRRGGRGRRRSSRQRGYTALCHRLRRSR